MFLQYCHLYLSIVCWTFTKAYNTIPILILSKWWVLCCEGSPDIILNLINGNVFIFAISMLTLDSHMSHADKGMTSIMSIIYSLCPYVSCRISLLTEQAFFFSKI